jgi:hypothetical protein
LPADTEHLRCAECGTTAPDEAPGWKAYPTGEDGKVDGIETFCPDCAATEFEPDSAGT